MSGITQAERSKYAEIFQARGQVNGYMAGNKKSTCYYFRLRKRNGFIFIIFFIINKNMMVYKYKN